MRAQVSDAPLGGEDGLGAVAVMHVEIDHGDARQAVRMDGMGGADGDAVEQAEAHGGVAGGMVAGRAHRAEGARCLAAHDRIDGRDHGTSGAPGGLGRFRRHRRVRIKAHEALAVEAGVEDRIDEGLGVHAFRGLAAGQGRFEPVERLDRGAKGFGHRLQARRALGVSGAGVVLEAGRVRVDAHQRLRSCRQSTSPWPLSRAKTRHRTKSRSERRLR